MCPIITLGGLRIESYDLMTWVGFFLGAAYFYFRAVSAERIDRYRIVVFLILAFLAQWIGGSIIPFVHQWQERGAFPSDLLLGGAGRYYHSALLASIFFVIVYTRAKKWPTLRFLDYFAVAACIMSAVGRIGCYLTGCCGGKPSNLPWAIRFPFEPVKVHPTQLYQLGFEAVVLLPVLIAIDYKKRFDGQTFWSYLFIYSIFRFSVEYLRTNPVAFLGMSHAQLFSLAAVLVSGVVLAKKR